MVEVVVAGPGPLETTCEPGTDAVALFGRGALGALPDSATETVLEGDVGPVGPVVDVEVRGPRGSQRGKAILDTGAARSAVSLAAARAVGAKVVGRREGKTPCGSCEMEVFRVELVVSGIHFQVDAVGSSSIDRSAGIALLGQDFLSRGVLVSDGPARRFRFTGTIR